MSDSGGELIVTVRGVDVGLAPLLTRMEALGRQADASLTQSGQRIGSAIGAGASRATPSVAGLGVAAQRTARENISLASVYARGQAAAGDYAGAIARLTGAVQSNAAADERTIARTQNLIAQYERAAVAARAKAQAEAQSSRSTGGGGIAQAVSGELVGQVAGLVGPAALATAGLAALKGAADSLEQSFTFKANLDATTNSIKLQLAGVRDSGPVFQEASAFGKQYAFTQSEMTGVVAASVGILRTSTSSFTDLAGVLARMQVLAPGKSIEDAAFSVRELASGDITSIAEQFNISRGKAYEMRDAINGGKDAVQVLKQYLDGAGIGMDTLAARTTGAIGKMNELKQREEEMQLAEAQWAQGPGIAILEGKITALRGATRLLSGDFSSAGQSLVANVSAYETFANTLKYTGDISKASAAAQQAYARAAGLSAQATQANTQATQAGAAAGGQAAGAWMTQAEAAQQSAQAATDAAAKDLLAQVNTDILSDSKTRLAAQARAAAQAVIDGGGNITATTARLASSSSQVDVLTAAYIRLMAAQQAAGIAGAQRLKDQAAQTRDLTGGRGAVLGGPGTTGSGDPGAVLKFIADQKAATQATRDQQFALANQAGQIGILRGELGKLTPGTEAYIKKQTDLLKLEQDAATGKGRGGGGGKVTQAEKDQKALLKAQDDYQFKSQDSAEKYEEEMGKIAEDGAKKREQAQREYQQASLDSRAGFYAQLANVKDPKLAQQMSADYEAAVQKAAEIGRTKGADAAQAYLQASQQAIQNQSQLKGDIAQADKDKDKPKAEYLRGLLKLQQDADNNRLKQVEDAGSAIATAEEKQYSEAELRYAKHLDTLGETYARKVKDVPGLGASLGGAGGAATIPNPPAAASVSPAASAATGAGAGAGGAGATLVTDPATQAAIDQWGGRIEGKLGDVIAAVNAVEKRVGDVERAASKGRSALSP